MVSEQFLAEVRAAAERLEQPANRRLVQSGLFSQVTGPKGGIPIQASGTLRNGERFYFRERFGVTEVELNGTVVSKVQATSMMTPDQAATYILNYLRTH